MKENSAVKIPSLPAVVVDPGKVRVGGYSPAFPGRRAKCVQPNIADNGTIRMGSFSPLFPAPRAE